MYKFKQFMLQAQKQKKCPPGYRFDKKLQVCVPTGVTRYYPYFGGKNGNGQNDQQSSDNNTNDNGTNGNGTNGNGSNGNGGGE
jgi:hypothetical protein